MDSINKKFRFLLLIALIVSILGCHEEPRTRPYGYIKIGKISELMQPESRLWDLRLIVRYDQGGFSAMSTECTYDLAPLKTKMKDGREILYSDFSDSTYDLSGKVLTGPSKFALPYYRLEFGQGAYEGPYDTLYVAVGEEKDPSWRLAIPAAK